MRTVNIGKMGGIAIITGMLWETSLLDAEEGIRFKGFTIPELGRSFQPRFPVVNLCLKVFSGCSDWQTPHEAAQVDGLSKELRSRAHLPAHVIDVLERLPAETHPMTQLSIAMALQTESKFAKAYQKAFTSRSIGSPCLRIPWTVSLSFQLSQPPSTAELSRMEAHPLQIRTSIGRETSRT